MNYLIVILKNDNISEAMNVCNDISFKIKHRNKLIKMVDRSAAGCSIVEECEVDPITSGPVDSKKINQTENRALNYLNTKR